MRFKLIPRKEQHGGVWIDMNAGDSVVYPVKEFVACQEHFEECSICSGASIMIGLPPMHGEQPWETQYCHVGKALFQAWSDVQRGECAVCGKDYKLFLRKGLPPVCLTCLQKEYEFTGTKECYYVNIAVPGFDPRPLSLSGDHFAAPAPGWPGQRDGKPWYRRLFSRLFGKVS
jgi:hypothetical protein